MTVYVDLLFGLNTILNYLLLRGSAVIGGCPAKLARLLAAAAAGGVYAVAAVAAGALQSMACQALCACLMLVIAFGWKCSTIRQGLYFLALSFALSGAVLLLVRMVEPDCILLNGTVYYACSAPALLLIAGVGYGLSAAVLAGVGTHTGGDLVSMTLELRDQTTQLCALRDTGNVLRDPVTGQAVLVAESCVMERLLPGTDSAMLRDPGAAVLSLAKQYPRLQFRLIPYHTVGVESGLLLAVRCHGRWQNKKGTVLTAFSPTTVSSDGRFQAIWGGEIV